MSLQFLVRVICLNVRGMFFDASMMQPGGVWALPDLRPLKVTASPIAILPDILDFGTRPFVLLRLFYDTDSTFQVVVSSASVNSG